MSKKHTLYLGIILFLGFSHGILGQKLRLNLIGKDSIETARINSLEFKKNHRDQKSIYNELESIQKQLQYLGYFTNKIDNISSFESENLVSFSLGPKVNKVRIIIPKNIQQEFIQFQFIKKDSIEIKPFEIDTFIQSILKEFDSKGKSFTEIKLDTPKIKGSLVVVWLSIINSKERIIDKVIIKGYDNFPKSYLKKYYKLNSDKNISKELLKEVSLLTKYLEFVEEIKPPEILFKQDSTLLYMFLRRSKTSSVDGIINFGSKEDGSGLLINGNLDLKLNNVLNSGERFELFWNRVKESNSEFRLRTNIPYVFNSSLSLDFKFNIYRQDSLFLNTTFDLQTDYQISSTSKVFLTYSSESSDYLKNEIDVNLDSYSTNFMGLGYRYMKASENTNFDQLLNFDIAPSFGRRRNSGQKNDQFRFQFSALTNMFLGTRSYLQVKNQSGFLLSDHYLINELYRIGGAHSIRGFAEQSIFTSKYSFINLEYRYVTSLNSYLHTITDFGLFETFSLNRIETLLGAGIGYSFRIKNNKVNLGYAVGLRQNTGIDLDNSQIIMKWTSVF